MPPNGTLHIRRVDAHVHRCVAQPPRPLISLFFVGEPLAVLANFQLLSWNRIAIGQQAFPVGWFLPSTLPVRNLCPHDTRSIDRPRCRRSDYRDLLPRLPPLPPRCSRST